MVLRIATLALIVLTVGAAGPRPVRALSLGTVDPIPIPSPNPATQPPHQVASLATTPGGFTGTWTPPTLPDWTGTFSATGPIPSGTTNSAGLTTYDFTALPTAQLPAGTFFEVGDLDHGSGVGEAIILQAFDASNAAITSAWLDEPIFVQGSATAGDMPASSFDLITGTYTLDGSGVPGNPGVLFFLVSNVDIAFLEVTRSSSFANLYLSAPIPEPATATLLAIGLTGIAARRRRGRGLRGPSGA